RRVVVVSEREGMPALEPVEAGRASRVGPSYLQHDCSPRFAVSRTASMIPLEPFCDLGDVTPLEAGNLELVFGRLPRAIRTGERGRPVRRSAGDFAHNREA